MVREVSVDVAGVDVLQTWTVEARDWVAARHVEKEVGLTWGLDDNTQLKK